MMETNIQEYEFNMEKKIYRLKTSIINGNLLQIICTPKNQKYGYINIFSQGDLIKINKIFMKYNNITEVQKEFENCINLQKVSLLHNRTIFNILFYIPKGNKSFEKISLNLIYENEFNNYSDNNININNIKPHKKRNKYNDILDKLEKDMMNMAKEQEIMNNKIHEALNPDNNYEYNNKINNNINNDINNNEMNKSNKVYFNVRKLKFFIKSSILKTPEEYNLLKSKLLTLRRSKISQNINYKLLYKSSQDSDRAEIFHQKCDNIRNTITLIQTNKNKKFGGFTTQTWDGININKLDDNAFIFSLDKLKIYDINQGKEAITCSNEFGPIFCGYQILVYDNFFKKGGKTGKAYENYNIEGDFELTGGDNNFIIKELEVFEIIFE